MIADEKEKDKAVLDMLRFLSCITWIQVDSLAPLQVSAVYKGDTMKLSEKRKQAVYGAIHEQIMQLRISLQRDHQLSGEIDHKIAQTITPIWRDVKSALNVKEN